MKFDKNRKVIILTINEYQEGAENYCGYCLNCGEENQAIEPDAENYDCEACGEAKVFGSEQLLIIGKLEIE